MHKEIWTTSILKCVVDAHYVRGAFLIYLIRVVQMSNVFSFTQLFSQVKIATFYCRLTDKRKQTKTCCFEWRTQTRLAQKERQRDVAVCFWKEIIQFLPACPACLVQWSLEYPTVFQGYDQCRWADSIAPSNTCGWTQSTATRSPKSPGFDAVWARIRSPCWSTNPHASDPSKEVAVPGHSGRVPSARMSTKGEVCLHQQHGHPPHQHCCRW